MGRQGAGAHDAAWADRSASEYDRQIAAYYDTMASFIASGATTPEGTPERPSVPFEAPSQRRGPDGDTPDEGYRSWKYD